MQEADRTCGISHRDVVGDVGSTAFTGGRRATTRGSHPLTTTPTEADLSQPTVARRLLRPFPRPGRAARSQGAANQTVENKTDRPAKEEYE